MTELRDGVDEGHHLGSLQRVGVHVFREQQHLQRGTQAQHLQLAVQLALLTRDAVHHLADVVEHLFELGLDGRDGGYRATAVHGPGGILRRHVRRRGSEQHTLVERPEDATTAGEDVRVEKTAHQRLRLIVLRRVLAETKVHSRQRRRRLPQRAKQHHEREVQVAKPFGMRAVLRDEPRGIRGPLLSPRDLSPGGFGFQRDVRVDGDVHAGEQTVQHPLLVAHVVERSDAAEAILIVDGAPHVASVVAGPSLGVELEIDVVGAGGLLEGLAHVQPKLGVVLVRAPF